MPHVLFSELLNSYSPKGLPEHNQTLPGPGLGYATTFKNISIIKYYSYKAYHEGSMGEKWKAFLELEKVKVSHPVASLPLFNCDRTLLSSHATLLQIEMRW